MSSIEKFVFKLLGPIIVRRDMTRNKKSQDIRSQNMLQNIIREDIMGYYTTGEKTSQDMKSQYTLHY